MDFGLSDDQKLLQDTTSRVLADHGGFEQREAAMASERGWSAALWGQLARTGLTGLVAPEEHGGFGGGAVETMVVMEALGRSLALEPWLETCVLCTGLLLEGESRDLLLPGIVAGEITVSLAQFERRSRHDLADVSTVARAAEGGFALDGGKTLVLHGDSARWFVDSARLDGEIALFLVEAQGAGVSLRGYRTQDGRRAAEIGFAGAKATLLAGPERGLALLERARDTAIAGLCAEAVGAMSLAHEMTVDFLKIRKQFGVAIGGFQALQHRAADMYIALEQARSMAMLAAMALAEEPESRARQVRAAKIQIGRSGKFIGQQAVQLHGGIGVTMDYALGHAFKRLAMIDAMHGDADHHLGLLAGGPSILA